MEPKRNNPSDTAESAAALGAAWPLWLAPLVIALLTFVAFFPLAQTEFLELGERDLLLRNEHCHGLGLENLKWAIDTESAQLGGQYHPLVWFSFAVDWLLWKDEPRGYHLTNVLLHILSGILVYLIAGRLYTAASQGRPAPPAPGSTRVRLGALLAALLFAVHPLRVESVSWLLERRDVLSGFFFLASILCYLRCRDLVTPLSAEDPSVRKSGSPNIWTFLSVVLALCAILSKATAVCLPLVLIILDVYPLGASAKRIKGLWWDRAPFIIVAGIGVFTYLTATSAAVRARADQMVAQVPAAPTAEEARVRQARAEESARDALYPGPDRLASRAVMAAHGSLVLLSKMIVPAGLQPLYDPPDLESWSADAGQLAGSVAVVAVTVVLLVLRRTWPAGLVAWLCYLAMLLPVCGLARIGVPVEADRHSYLASMSWAVLLGAALWGLHRRPAVTAGLGKPAAVLAVVAAAAVLYLTGLTHVQSRVWRSDKSLWTRVAAVRSDTWQAHFALGHILRQENDLAGAELHYRRAIELEPDAWEVHNNLGQVLSMKGGVEGVEQALEHFRKAKELNPTSPAPRQNLGTNLFLLGRMDQAEAEFRELLDRLPEEAPARPLELAQLRARVLNDLGAVCYRQGRYDQAVESYRQCLAAFAYFPIAHQGLGDAWLAKGEVEQAIAHYEEALRLNPNNELVRRKLVELQGVQAGTAAPGAGATSTGTGLSDEERRQISEALARQREALDRDPDDAAAHYETARLLARTGRLEQCVYHCREAVRLKPDLVAAHRFLTMVLMRTNRVAEAVAAAREGLAHAPEDTTLIGPLAYMLATSGDPAIRDPEAALELSERGTSLEPNNPSLLEALAAALVVNDRLDQAIETLGRARTLAEAQGQTLLLERLSRQLERYERLRTARSTP